LEEENSAQRGQNDAGGETLLYLLAEKNADRPMGNTAGAAIDFRIA
jgi:hypothetical protein